MKCKCTIIISHLSSACCCFFKVNIIKRFRFLHLLEQRKGPGESELAQRRPFERKQLLFHWGSPARLNPKYETHCQTVSTIPSLLKMLHMRPLKVLNRAPPHRRPRLPWRSSNVVSPCRWNLIDQSHNNRAARPHFQRCGMKWRSISQEDVRSDVPLFFSVHSKQRHQHSRSGQSVSSWQS